MPVATNCCVRPIGIEAVAGVTTIVIDDTSAGKTVKVAAPDLPPKAAVMIVVPAVTPVAMPGETTVATPGVPEVHVTLALISWLELSE